MCYLVLEIIDKTLAGWLEPLTSIVQFVTLYAIITIRYPSILHLLCLLEVQLSAFILRSSYIDLSNTFVKFVLIYHTHKPIKPHSRQDNCLLLIPHKISARSRLDAVTGFQFALQKTI